MHIQAVLFDLFETLISEYKNGSRKSERSHLDYMELIGIPNNVFRKAWGDRIDKRMTGEYPDYPAVLRDIATSHQVEIADSRLEEIYQQRIEEKLTAFEEVDSSVLDMLEQLKRTGFKLALVSNCTEEEVRGWASSSLAPYFDEVLFSYKIGLAKPNVRLYELACSRIGVRVEQAVFVGDGGSNELAGAKEAGLTAFQSVWFVDEPYRKLQASCKMLETTEQLLHELRD